MESVDVDENFKPAIAQKLSIAEVDELDPIKLPNECWRDHKKLTRFLTEVETTVNKLVQNSKLIVNRFGEEFHSRPTYIEQYENFRLNVPVPTVCLQNEDIPEEGIHQSHKSLPKPNDINQEEPQTPEAKKTDPDQHHQPFESSAMKMLAGINQKKKTPTGSISSSLQSEREQKGPVVEVDKKDLEFADLGSINSESLITSDLEGEDPTSKIKAPSRYFISAPVVEKVFDNVQINYRLQFKKLQVVVEQHNKHLTELQRELIEKKVPDVEESLENLSNQCFNISNFMIRNWEKQRKLNLKKETFSQILEYKRIMQKDKTRLEKAIKHLRKFHQKDGFHTFKAKTMQEQMLADKNKIDGAYLIIKRFKNRLKQFDVALEHLHKTKATKDEFSILEKNIQQNTAGAIFEDMKQLFDATVKNIYEKVEADFKGLGEGYEYRLNENKMLMLAFEKKFSALMTDRINEIENQNQNIAMQQAQLASQIADLSLNVQFSPFSSPLSSSLPSGMLNQQQPHYDAGGNQQPLSSQNTMEAGMKATVLVLAQQISSMRDELQNTLTQQRLTQEKLEQKQNNLQQHVNNHLTLNFQSPKDKSLSPQIKDNYEALGIKGKGKLFSNLQNSVEYLTQRQHDFQSQTNKSGQPQQQLSNGQLQQHMIPEYSTHWLTSLPVNSHRSGAKDQHQSKSPMPSQRQNTTTLLNCTSQNQPLTSATISPRVSQQVQRGKSAKLDRTAIIARNFNQTSTVSTKMQLRNSHNNQPKNKQQNAVSPVNNNTNTNTNHSRLMFSQATTLNNHNNNQNDPIEIFSISPQPREMHPKDRLRNQTGPLSLKQTQPQTTIPFATNNSVETARQLNETERNVNNDNNNNILASSVSTVDHLENQNIQAMNNCYSPIVQIGDGDDQQLFAALNSNKTLNRKGRVQSSNRMQKNRRHQSNLIKSFVVTDPKIQQIQPSAHMESAANAIREIDRERQGLTKNIIRPQTSRIQPATLALLSAGGNKNQATILNEPEDD